MFDFISKVILFKAVSLRTLGFFDKENCNRKMIVGDKDIGTKIMTFLIRIIRLYP